MYKYLEKEEDEYFSKVVRRVNSIEDEKEREEKRKDLFERTSLLIYYLTKERMYLGDDDAVEIYLICQNELEDIISGFKISGSSFNSYLLQVVRYRLRRIKREKTLNSLYDYEYRREDINDGLIISDSLNLKYEEEEKEILQIGDFSSLSFKETVTYIVENGNRYDLVPNTREEKTLSSMLENKRNRECLVVLISSLPKESTIVRTENFSRVFHTDEGAFIRLLSLCDSFLARTNERKEKFLSIASKHWRLMCVIRSEMERAESDKERKMLSENYNTQVRLHQESLKKAEAISSSVSRQILADELGYKATKIDYLERKGRELLSSVLEKCTKIKEGENIKPFPRHDDYES